MAASRRDQDLTGDATHADANRDPLSGEAGAHPVGTGLGTAAGGAAAGAAGGAVAGPIGAIVGAVVGGIAGGLAGKGVAESIDPTVEDAHWRSTYNTRPYSKSGHSYDEYQPAYQYGWESRSQHAGRSFDEAEGDLAQGWEKAKSKSSLAWDHAKHATRDAWERIDGGTTSTGSGTRTL